MNYASPAWALISKFNVSRLQIVQNRALRIIRVYDWHTRTEQLHFHNEIPLLKSFTKSLALKLHVSARTSIETGVSKS